jgi:enoyl-CoA hydratase/carnithine racemase
MCEDLLTACALLRQCAASNLVRVVLLDAEGPVFCAGADLKERQGMHSQAEVTARRQLAFDAYAALEALPQPVIAKVHALATAAGCQLVATCDLALAADSASFAIPGGKASLFCHTPLVAVARNIGRKRAMEMALTGDAIDATTAADWGLINHAVPADQLDAATLDLISRASRGCAVSKAMGKQGYYQQIDLPQPEAYAVSGERMSQGAAREAAQESFYAFLNKNKA